MNKDEIRAIMNSTYLPDETPIDVVRIFFGTDDDGSETTYLLTSDGMVFFSKSVGVASSAHVLAQYDLLETDGILVKSVSIPRPNGRTVKKLVIV